MIVRSFVVVLPAVDGSIARRKRQFVVGDFVITDDVSGAVLYRLSGDVFKCQPFRKMIRQFAFDKLLVFAVLFKIELERVFLPDLNRPFRHVFAVLIDNHHVGQQSAHAVVADIFRVLRAASEIDPRRRRYDLRSFLCGGGHCGAHQKNNRHHQAEKAFHLAHGYSPFCVSACFLTRTRQ